MYELGGGDGPAAGGGAAQAQYCGGDATLVETFRAIITAMNGDIPLSTRLSLP